MLSNGLTIASNYGQDNRRRQMVLPDGSYVSYSYDPLYLTSIGRYGKSGECLYRYEYGPRDLGGHLLSATLPFDLGDVIYDYDKLGRRIGVKAPFFTQNALLFDGAQNLLKQEREGEELSYKYDALYQLIEEEGHTYEFDCRYNRVRKDDSCFEANALNQTSALEYDQDGNPTFFKEKTLHYDALDRLISIEGEGRCVKYEYDSYHRRVAKTTYRAFNGSFVMIDGVRYLYDGENEIGSYTSFCTELRVLGETSHAEIGAAVTFELHGRLYAPIHDLQGNVAAMTSRDGAIERYSYTAYGEETVSSWINPWRFSSKRSDPETGFVYYGRRYYMPELGRWLTSDPLGLQAGPNLYAFVCNSPLTHFDLYGLIQEEQGFVYGCTQAVIGALHGTQSFLTSSLVGISALGYWSTCYPVYFGAKAFGGDGIASYLSPDSFRASARGFESNASSFMQRHLPGDHGSEMFQSARFRTEQALDAATIVSGIGGLALKSYRHMTVLAAARSAAAPVAAKIAEGAAQRTTSFTAQNFRRNYIKSQGGLPPPKGMDVHHVFPQKHEFFFNKQGLNIHNPKYGTYWEKHAHRQNAYQYNKEWHSFKTKYPDATAEQMLQQGKGMMLQKGIKTNY